MKEKAIKINLVSLGISGLAFLTMLYFSYNVFFIKSATTVGSYFFMFIFLVCITFLYRTFKDNEHPFQAMRHSFNYILDKVMK